MLKYLMRNFFHIAGLFLLAVFTVFFLCPLLLKYEISKKVLGYSHDEPFMAFTALIAYCIVNRWVFGIKLWQRYINSYKLEKLPLLYPDYLVIFISFVGLLTIKCYASWDVKITPQVKSFIISNSVFIFTWLVGTYCWSWMKNYPILNISINLPWRKIKLQAADQDKYSLADEAITDIGDDLLGREKFVNDLYGEVVGLPTNDSFVFGLYGGWGEGKTSVLNLLKNKIQKNDEFLVVNFDPWYFRDVDAILNAFYKEIECVITQNFMLPDLGRSFSKYRKIISTGIASSGVKIDFNFDEETVEGMKHRVEAYILQTQRKIAIFIDDIDRLQADEILLIFNLVRNNSKFKNTIFILCFDKDYVVDVLEEKWSTRGYINKQEVDLVHVKKDYVC